MLVKIIRCDFCGQLIKEEEVKKMFFSLQEYYDICPNCYKELMKKISNVKKFGPKEQ